MHLIELRVGHFKNLRDLSMRFDVTSPYTVLVGENGAGKSNVMEALATIFRNLDLDERGEFSYTVKYQCRSWIVRVEAESNEWPRIQVSEADALIEAPHEIGRREFNRVDADGRPLYRPAFIFAYYSGPGDRLRKVCDRHRERFYNWIIKPIRRKEAIDPNTLRRLFYAETLHGQFALLAFFMDSSVAGDRDREFLRERLQIAGLDSVLFCLSRPPWRPRASGDSRFWGAEGEVREFLSHLYSAATFPMRADRRMTLDFARTQVLENLYLFLADRRALADVYRHYSDQYSFFTALESTHLSKLLQEVRIRIRVAVGGREESLTYRDLSEGEQQLLLVLGLLKFTARDEALFLLDEPDTHLNPAWSAEYLSFLDRFIQVRAQDSCHIVMSTHDPLVFARLNRSQVSIMRRDEKGYAVSEIPDQDPRGMGVAAILTSDLFRLRSTLDEDTQNELDRQRELASKERTAAEDVELAELTSRLNKLGMARAVRDPLFELFVREWTARRDPDWSGVVQLSPEQREARERLASQIVEQLLEAER